MKRSTNRTPLAIVIALIFGWFLGTTGVSLSQAEEVSPAPVVQGEILKVCINLKTGVIRASNKCVAKTERKSILGGVGAQGEVGPQGAQGETGTQGIQGINGDTGVQGTPGIQGVKGDTGLQGDRGFTGLTGAAGSVAGLRTETIYYYNGKFGSDLSCYAGLLANYSMAAISTSGTKFTATPCKKDVYVP